MYDRIEEIIEDLKQFIVVTVAQSTADLAKRDDVLNLGRRVGNLELQFDSLEQRFDSLEQRFDSLENRFDSLENRFDSLEQRFDNFENHINKRLDELDTKLVTIADAHSEILTEHEGRLSRLEIKPA